MWDFTGTVQGSCINTTAFFYCKNWSLSASGPQKLIVPATSTFNIITDIWILGLPFKTLRSIQRPNREKVALFLIFGAGAFACVASIIRLYSIRIFTESDDPFRDGIPVNLWSMIEVTVAISCASVPAFKPIFSRHQRAATRAARSKSSSGMYSSNTAATGSGMQYTPQASRSMCDPERAFSPAGHLRLDSDISEARDMIHATLGFHPQERPPIQDRDNTGSSGFSLGLPMQTPPPRSVPPPLMPRTLSHGRQEEAQDQGRGIVVPPPQQIHHQHPQRPKEDLSRNPSQTSIDSATGGERPPIPRRRSSTSQRSVRIEILPRPAPPSRNPSQTSLERPGMGSRNPSQRSLPLASAMRPAGPSKQASQSSFYLE